ncbi:hypothetical protein FIBSPDRAFT_1037716 [Athelia psychrophila]|uniref:Uncharacterized protein n=1 Tax=Athelia psychrophila TaxID=1759441 RepID=A0A166U330_9AGAM|nr:hypothetical protein FIBSPDRAFT_1037716 [Fibularhizoctonia sp. CBS 109695]
MDPEPISPLALNVILQYILPPSQLSEPLPKHLTSTPLLQRHHFLNISPSDPLEYLCWPSENRARALELLEDLSTHKIEDDAAKERDIQYTSDVEHTYAHVNPAKDLRLVFQWDGQGEDGWKYHDTTIMPFPPGSIASLPDALAQASAQSSGPDHSYLGPLSAGCAFGVIEDEEPASDDDYWNAYGAQDDGENPVIHKPKPIVADGSEDAYWAQYSSIQGSGDSTVPTPSRSPTGRRTFPPYLHEDEPTPPMSDRDDDMPLPIAIRGHDRQSNLVPPSPASLTRRLKSISPRLSPASTRPSSRGPTPIEPSPLSFEDIEPSPLSFEDKSPEATTDGSCTAVISPQSQSAVLESSQPPPPMDGKDVVDDDAPLRESIRSVWRLWKMSRRSAGDADNKETFLRVAKEVVEIP